MAACLRDPVRVCACAVGAVAPWQLLEHLYTDSDTVPSELALELFSAADLFQVSRRPSACARQHVFVVMRP